ncbi:hypothetical protein [Viridibacillus arvi]|uniref:hypothetical protein n=1 Tax=Viridibacillus arvi TaxID=263475 RepID=UPI0034CD1C14
MLNLGPCIPTKQHHFAFYTDSTSTLTLVLISDFSKFILVNGVIYKASKGLITVELEAGVHTITKDTANLYYMSVD